MSVRIKIPLSQSGYLPNNTLIPLNPFSYIHTQKQTDKQSNLDKKSLVDIQIHECMDGGSEGWLDGYGWMDECK